MAIIGNSIRVSTQSNSKLFIIKGKDERYTFSPLGLARVNSDNTASDRHFVAPTIDKETASYITMSVLRENTDNYRQLGAYVSSSQLNLTGYNRLILEYDITAGGNTSTYRHINPSVWVRGGDPTATNAYQFTTRSDNSQRWSEAANVLSGQTLTDQTLTLDISADGWVYVGIGLNETGGGGVTGTLTIKRLYAEV